ncbi:hypothetical protein SLEP1_g55057 [Rubroshorea leprosula]|uniref:Uncharacterized protein n=1 Tax=Rubroshorea leprosula TaxID=152421 RepID=A0AAV5MI19_9ROSI|nr:hypothetical protein SLEP1_g55057 [Rubroshorea leprosula]
MPSLHDAQEFRGNQGKDEEIDVISVEPIAMIVPPELQDSPNLATPKSSASSSAGGGFDNHRPSTSSDSSMEKTSSEAEGVEEVGCSASAMSATAEVVVFEGAALHHEVVNGAATVKGLGMPAKAVVFRSLFLCRLCPSTSRTRWYYISRREKMMIFTNIRNKVARWKRQFVFIRDTRTERINNELAARLLEWRKSNAYMNYPQLTIGDVNLKNRLLDHVKARGLVDLEALVTPEQIALLGFVNVANLHGEGEMSSILEKQCQRAQGLRNCGAGSGSQCQTRFDKRPPAALGRSSSHRSSNSALRPHVEQKVEPAPSSSRRRTREDSDAEDDVPLIRWRTSMGNQPAPAAAARPANVPPTPAREVVEPTPASSSVAKPRIAYLNGFSYVRTDCQAAMLQGMQSFVPPIDRQRVKGHVQQHGGHAALIKLMDAFSCTVALFECEQRARSLEMANRAVSAKSRADELARKVNELKEELKRAQAEKESDIQAAKEEASFDQHVALAEASLERTKRLHQGDVCFAHAQGAEWLVGAEMFQDAVAITSANTTTDIFNEVRGKVLRVRADFPIGELAFFEGKEIDEDGNSLTQPADTRVRLKWELNEEGLPVWPPTVVEEGEDIEGLPSFDAWVAGPQDMLAEPSSTPPSAQPQPQPVSAAALAPSPSDRPSPTRFVSTPNDASIPVYLTDD